MVTVKRIYLNDHRTPPGFESVRTDCDPRRILLTLPFVIPEV